MRRTRLREAGTRGQEKVRREKEGQEADRFDDAVGHAGYSPRRPDMSQEL